MGNWRWCQQGYAGDTSLEIPVGQGIVRLVGNVSGPAVAFRHGQGFHQMPARKVGTGDIAHFPGLDQVVQGFQGFVYRCIGIETVHMVNVDIIGAQASQAVLAVLHQLMARRAVMGRVALVEINTLSRSPAVALPRISSDVPREYTLAVSKRWTPASRHRCTIRVASSTWVLPQVLKNSVPPKVPVPKLRTGTINPDCPDCLYSMFSLTAIP